MIIRNRNTKTVKPSMRNNRSVRRTCGVLATLGQHSERVPAPRLQSRLLALRRCSGAGGTCNSWLKAFGRIMTRVLI